MFSRKIRARAFGKWILAGEHSVVRGGSCLLFPLRSVYLEVTYIKSDQALTCEFDGTFKDPKLKEHCLDVVRQALDMVQRPPTGTFFFYSNIPLGCGLGGSAAFCVSLSKLFCKQGWLEEEAILPLSLKLEHFFHGVSSGADVYCVYHDQILLFQNNKDAKEKVEFIQPRNSFNLHLLDTGQSLSTKKCVEQVQEWVQKFPEESRKVDQKMQESVSLCQQALTGAPENSLDILTQGIEQARECFEDWNLCSSENIEKFKELKSEGALAIKPTGSGGGMILSLWKEPRDLKEEGYWVKF